MNVNINLKLRRFVKGETQHWMPVCKEAKLLWCHFIGFTFWPGGYWIHHTDNQYVNIQVVERGTLTVHTSHGKTVVPAGAAVIIPPGDCKLEASSPEGVSKRHLSIMGTLCLQSLAAFGFEQITLLSDFKDPQFDQEFEKLCKMAGEQNPEEIFDYTSRICKIMFMLADKVRSRNFPPTFIKARFFIECNFAKNISLAEICLRSGCSKTTLQHQFKEILGMTPMHYLTEVRMKYALQLLEREDFSIKMISGMCGYENALYFSNVFKEFHGLSPRDCRKKLTRGN
jgi:AraC-like DNA-binding protein